jgi:phosphoglycolate phosphatase-like HAD superfamily hydrolase
MGQLKLFLFDLDGTLISTGGAGLRALNLTFERIYGLKNITERVSCHGKTDPAIFREAIKTYLDREMHPSELPHVSSTYLRYLSIEIRYSKDYRVLAGVEPFLDYLMTRGDILLGLGTGNLEAGARIKLLKSSLNPYFPFGGFGSDAEAREEVLRHAHARAEARCKQKIKESNVFVIGDTILDVKAARLAGYQAVAVAQGGSSLHELRAHEPDYLLPDMHDGFRFLKDLERSRPGVAL